MPFKLSKTIGDVEDFVTKSSIASGVFRNMILTTLIVVSITMLIILTTGLNIRSFCLSILFVGMYMTIHHMTYKNFYKKILNHGDNSNIIGNDVIDDVVA